MIHFGHQLWQHPLPQIIVNCETHTIETISDTNEPAQLPANKLTKSCQTKTSLSKEAGGVGEALRYQLVQIRGDVMSKAKRDGVKWRELKRSEME